MSKNRITKMVLMGLALILTGIVCMLGVMAITDSKLVNFKLGTKYEPAFNIEVYTTTIYNQNETKSLVFKSVNPSEVNYNAHYIDSVTNDTILFKTENLKTDNGVVVLTIVNNENKSLQAIINKGAQVEVIDAGAEKAISVEIGTTNLGLFLFSLQIVEYAPYGASYNLSGCSLISGPEIIASETITSEIILQANDADNTKWTISATSGEIETEYIWQSALMQVKILLKNVTEATTLTAKAEIDYWDGTAEAFPYGNGTEENPYLIRNGKHLHYLADITNAGTGETLNKHYKMMNNIYLNEGTFGIDNETNFNPTYNGSTTIPATVHQWEPIGYGYLDESNSTIPVTYFEGVFDGSSYNIQGLYINNEECYQGVFALSSEKSVIKNFSTSNGYMRAGCNFGGICGYHTGLILNVYNAIIICGAESVYGNVGGIAGVNSGIIENTKNKSSIKSVRAGVGGIAGVSNYIIKNCKNFGKIICTTSHVGGIVGGIHNYGNLDHAQLLEECSNYGFILGNGRVGGIAGGAYSGAGVLIDATLKNCKNLGYVQSIAGECGGVIGFISTPTTIDGVVQEGLVKILDCYNTGEVFGANNAVAGICGSNKGGIISFCYNMGIISGYGTSGGIVGDTPSRSLIKNSYNCGAIYGNNNCAGVVGGLMGYGNVTMNCFNAGIINTRGTCGGIAGGNFYKETEIANKIEYCYNTGFITGKVCQQGGISGYNYNGLSDGSSLGGAVNYCINTGKVKSEGFCSGGVLGTNTDNITATNNNFYLSGCAKDGNDVVQNGMGNATKGSTTADISGRTNVLTSAQNGARMIFDYTGEPYSATVNSSVFLANSNTLATDLGVGNYLFKYNGSTWDFYRSDFGGMFLVATGIPTSTLTSTTSLTGYGITITGTLTENAVIAIFAVNIVDGDVYKVTLNNQSATTAGTGEFWYIYNVYKNGFYYYQNQGCTVGLSGAKITIPTKTGYTFGGYWTGTNGTGTQYINSSGVCINNIYKVQKSQTLYAYWIAK